MEDTHQKPHAIMIAYPLQGHINPCVHLATKLASNGLTITFVNTEQIHHKISTAHRHRAADDDLFAEARQLGLDIRYTTVSDSFPIEFDRHLHLDQFMEGFLNVFPVYVDEFVGKMVRNSDPPVNCLIADTLHVWPSRIAEKYKLVNVSLWTGPALVFNLYYHLDLLRSNGHFDSINGINLCDKNSITREEVAEKISHLMDGNSADELRREIKKVKRTLDSALATNGSSEKNFNQFIKDVKVKIQDNN